MRPLQRCLRPGKKPTTDASAQGRLDYDIDYGDVDRIAELLEKIAACEEIRDILADGETVTDTESPTDIMDLISKYASGDLGSGEEEE